MLSFSTMMRRRVCYAAMALLLVQGKCDPYLFVSPDASAATIARIKDVAQVEGVRDNMLVGYGLVVGLSGTGDNLSNSTFTEASLRDHLSRMKASTGLDINQNSVRTKNVAAVVVTATLPPFAKNGSRIFVNVSTLGDARNILNGVLLATPLLGADGEVYALAQGSIAGGAVVGQAQQAAGVGAGRQQARQATTGHIVGGGIVEKEVPFDMNKLDTLYISLKNPDASTARSVVTAINSAMRGRLAFAEDPGTISLAVPSRYKNNLMAMLAEIESLTIIPDQPAKVVIDEATGTVVMGENVRISKVAISQGGLVIRVEDEVSDKLAFLGVGQGSDAQQLPRSQQSPQSEPGTKMLALQSGATLEELVRGLNTLGVKTADLIAILKSIEQAGALQGVLEMR